MRILLTTIFALLILMPELATAEPTPVVAVSFDRAKVKAESYIFIGLPKFALGRSGDAVYIDENTYGIFPIDNKFTLKKGTIAFWVKPDWCGSKHRDWACFFRVVNDTSDKKKNILECNMGARNKQGIFKSGTLRFSAIGKDGKRLTVFTDISRWEPETWHHIACVWRNLDGSPYASLFLYVDGENIGRYEIPLYAISQNAERLSITLGKIMSIGASVVSGQNRQSLNGAIDEFCVFDKALTVEQMRTYLGDTVKSIPIQKEQASFLGMEQAEFFPDRMCQWSASISDHFYPPENLKYNHPLHNRDQDFWSSGQMETPVWIQCDLKKKQWINGIFIKPRDLFAARLRADFCPNSFRILASIDGGNFKVLKQCQMPQTNGLGLYFRFEPIAAKCVRLVIDQLCDTVGNCVQLERLRLCRPQIVVESISLSRNSDRGQKRATTFEVQVNNEFSIAQKVKVICLAEQRNTGQVQRQEREVYLASKETKTVAFSFEFEKCLFGSILISSGVKTGGFQTEWCKRYFETGINVVEDVLTDRVTYRALSGRIRIRAKLKNPLVNKLLSQTKARFWVEDPISGQVLNEQTKSIKPEDRTSISAELDVTVSEMRGLLARVSLSCDGKVVGEGETPFDMTNDIRRNWRWGQNCDYPLYKLGPAQNDRTELIDYITRSVTASQEVDIRRRCFLNSVFFITRNYKGNYTPWEEHGDISEVGMNTGILINAAKMRQLASESNRHGVLPMAYIDPKYFNCIGISTEHPWIKAKGPFHRNFCQMNEDTSINYPLSKTEEKLFVPNSHGARNWSDYLADEVVRATKHLNLKAMWFDNIKGGNDNIANVITMAKAELGNNYIFMGNPGYRRIRADIANLVDILWVEWFAPRTMQQIRQQWQDFLYWNRKSGQNQDYPENINVYWSVMLPSSYKTKVHSNPEFINNDPSQIHVFRQTLFEAVACDADIVGFLNYPRLLETRYYHNPAAFMEHTHTWGFLCLYNHLYNSPDIKAISAEKAIRIAGYPVCYEDEIKDGKIHVFARQRKGQKCVILHLFNYIGTTAQVCDKRPAPQALNSVAIQLSVPWANCEVSVVSPDNFYYHKVVRPTVKKKGTKLNFDISLKNYTMIVVQKKSGSQGGL